MRVIDKLNIYEISFVDRPLVPEWGVIISIDGVPYQEWLDARDKEK